MPPIDYAVNINAMGEGLASLVEMKWFMIVSYQVFASFRSRSTAVLFR